jgi:hypothetical protein
MPLAIEARMWFGLPFSQWILSKFQRLIGGLWDTPKISRVVEIESLVSLRSNKLKAAGSMLQKRIENPIG